MSIHSLARRPLSPEAEEFIAAFSQLEADDQQRLARLIHALADEHATGGGTLAARLLARPTTDRDHIRRILDEFATQ